MDGSSIPPLLNRAKRSFGALLAILFLASLCGCAKKVAQLRIYPTQGLPGAQKFPRAFIGTNELGDSEIVLVSEGNQQTRKQGKILYPTAVGSVKQIVHIRILWKPLPGTRADQPTATNATINWYVRSNMPDQESDRLDYSGAGFVSIYPNKTGAHVVVKNANLALRNQSGDMTDAFGKPLILGSFDVIRNDGVVKDVVASLNTRVASR
jgi:hypothetical protein